MKKISIPQKPEDVTQDHIDWVATEIMGWKKCMCVDGTFSHWYKTDKAFPEIGKHWNPFKRGSWNHAMMVVEKVRKKFMVLIGTVSDSDFYMVRVDKWGTDKIYSKTHINPAFAITTVIMEAWDE